MKKIYLIAFFFVFLFHNIDSQASHMAGGEITWVCLPNGQYVFKMEIFKECSGPSFFFNNQIISYQGGSILMKPDSNRWLTYGAGNISPQGPSGCKRSCSSPAQVGAIQFFPYVSDPMTLNGVPPPGGWLFTWSLCCRPSTVVNLNQPGSQSFTLRSRMYPYQGRNANSCYDSSPYFMELPAILICKNTELIFNHVAADTDLDSLVFSWAEPWDQVNVPVNFGPAYSYDSPMPDTTFHPLNQPAVLNSQSGEIRFATYSGQSGQHYATTLQVDAYRNGTKIASVYRDIPFILFDCPVLPGVGMPNNPPTAMINGIPAIDYVDTVYAGQKVSLPFQSTENDIVYTDPTDPTTAHLQQNFISPKGLLFSIDFNDPSACKTLNISPCATLTPPPTINPVNGEYELTNQGTVTTTFEWQTSCDHLTMDSSGRPSNGRTYNFIMKTYDDHCDVPGIIYPSISIHVVPFTPTIQKIGNDLVVDSGYSYQWFFNDAPIGNSDTNRFTIQALGKYSVELVGFCAKRADFMVTNTSVEEIAWKKNLKIYPNPFKNGFIVEVGSLPSDKLELELMDVSGREIKSIVMENTSKINIGAEEKLEQGVYILKISSGNQSVLKKMVKL